MAGRTMVAGAVAAGCCALAACGGSTAPPAASGGDPALLLRPADLPVPGLEVSKRFHWTTAAQVARTGLTGLARHTPAEATAALDRDHFASGNAVVLSKGGENVIEMVLRVGTPAQARDLLGWVHADELLPCRVSCEVAIRPIRVPAIPGAVGTARVVDTRGGAASPPYDRYLVDFTIGPRLVLVERAGAPGVPTAREALTAATAAYRRLLAG